MDDSRIFEAISDLARSDLMLVVDLDGTLIHTDMLYETLWSSLSGNARMVVAAALALREGKPALKRLLAESGEVDINALPYNQDVIEYIQNWRKCGGRTALVSASDEALVKRVADHLGIFDEAHGTTGDENLKGATKAARLDALYGKGGYVYVGDSKADLAVWRGAARAVTVGLPDALRTEVELENDDVLHLSDRPSYFGPLLKAMRPHQWLKNLLVFLPLMASHNLSPGTIFPAILAFVSFCLIASSVYLLNDLLDLSADRAHPRKRKRPFASGALPLAWGTVVMPGLLLAGAVIALSISWEFTGVMMCYFAVTTLYSFWLKRRLVVDICALAGLYTLRIIAGGVATQIDLSVWLLAFSMFFFFSLAAMKRQAELVSKSGGKSTIIAGRDYRTTDMPLVANMAVSSGYVSVMVMALYLNSPAVRELYSYPGALWGICLVLLFWISRMVMITHRGWMHDDPVVFAARDRISLVCFALIFAFAVGGIVL
ncbi:UbiA family prenyltransferase [Alloyangia pacifica]|uniref:UbiA family prenyltransferase n=1 Tax=Alloyangia pacifica TaxID=311180 RepID=UPI001CD80BE6|nr:UbiA family prenyltransferase [Alloyangia pacifica]MCA0997303.1 UbiA family prenyltransferase [Alloyangia pacifica]